jgi:hypothetical protein
MGEYISECVLRVTNPSALVQLVGTRLTNNLYGKEDFGYLELDARSQDEIRAAFLNWANLNRNANAELASPIPPQKATLFG